MNGGLNVAVETESRIRRLIYFPIVHNLADMGALSESVRKVSVKKIGRLGWKRKVNLIDKFWDEIERAIDGLPLTFPQVRIYQDGLPVSEKASDIVRELAKSGSRNHALLLRLIDKGAQLMGTESLELLLEEYEMARRGLESQGPKAAKAHDTSPAASLLGRRDRFIAQRINETLMAGEVGIIFLGMLHDLKPWLATDIQVDYPIHRPAKA